MNHKFGEGKTPEGYWRDANGQLRKKDPKMAERRLMDFKRYTERSKISDEQKEKRNELINSLLSFTEESLVQLLDDGLVVKVDDLEPESSIDNIRITLSNYKNNKLKKLKWSECKDYLIPFFTLLKKKFSIRKVKLSNTYKFRGLEKESNYEVDINNIIKDKIHVWDDSFTEIIITV
jgi:hypothetical protein